MAIVSSRPQTTRNAVRGVLTRPDAQLVFVDTPGLHRPRTALGERLNRLVYGTLADGDAVVFVLDATQKIGPGDRLIAEHAIQVPIIPWPRGSGRRLVRLSAQRYNGPEQYARLAAALAAICST